MYAHQSLPPRRLAHRCRGARLALVRAQVSAHVQTKRWKKKGAHESLECIDMHVDVCMDMCMCMGMAICIYACFSMRVDMCTDVCMDMNKHMCIGMYIDMCLVMRIHMHIRTGMPIHTCV